ncbi:fibroblast growth factor 9-like [Dermacentor andersoni]|uniref:fibroblast growth factor 9-like n=1 Tax=Dermacentor andersoni TaxID=34620 RepID=UPI002155504E|nr:fibroblast growth factor 9-like [Dermacentor andersoni]
MPLPGCRNLVVVLFAMLLLLLVAASPKARAAPAAASSRSVDASAEDSDDNASSDSSQETTVRRLRHGRARAAAIAASADADELGEGSSSSEEQDSGGGGMVADDPSDANEAVKHPRGTSRYLQLYCRTGYNLVIHANGKVNGTREDRNRYAVLEMNAVAVKLYSIRGVASKRYLCMNRKGQLSGQKRRSEKCIFQLTELPNSYTTFSSMRYSRGTRWRWYLSIGKNGHVKRGRRPRQKGTNFLPRSVKDFKP